MIAPRAAIIERGTVRADHPMLAGHFPGHPIVPGAWLLAWVICAAQRQLAAADDVRAVAGVKRVKFARPLAPEQAFDCTFKRGTDTLRFTVTAGGAVVAEGSLHLQVCDD
jgi:3-hydroxymyristoyl/3-hydroxydecanoyl-(acyl carrier protein) dehydratase